MFVMMSQAMGKGGNPDEFDPTKLAEIARKAGAESKEEMTAEMQGLGVKLDKIDKAVNAVLAKVEIIDQKLDNVDSKLDKNFAESAERDENLRQIMLQSAAESARRDRIALDLMMKLGGKGIDKKFSTLEETERMGKRAQGVISILSTSHVKLIHPHGVGKDSFEKTDADHGQAGVCGADHPRARDGQHGKSAGQEGMDGDDGDDGDAGDDGHDGENGSNCPDYAVMIQLEKIHEDGCRTYKIEHSGQGEKEKFRIKIHPDKDVIYVNARGGNGGNGGAGGHGGKGGDGGNGGNGCDGSGQGVPDGGNGGNGGRGANGGHPGLGGHGGNGADGGRVVIHTNDPSVLAIIEVNACGGEAGKAGEHGKEGRGGVGGTGGRGGNKATWTESTQNGNTFSTRTFTGKEGREGKTGKSGKPGKKAPTRPSKAGRAGQSGSVSFCLYDNTGLSESGGTPYRVVFTKKELVKLHPIPRVQSVVITRATDRFLYGEELLFGPTLPENVGGMECPTFFMSGTLHVVHTEPYSTSVKRAFPAIPAETETRNGMLPVTAAQKLKVRLPTLAECNYECTGITNWPWSLTNGKTPLIQAKFVVAFEVDGIKLRQSEFDGNVACGKDYTVDLDIPYDFVEKNLKVISCPVSMSMSDANPVDVGFAVANKMSVTMKSTGRFKVAVHMAAPHFRPELVPKLEVSKFQTDTHLENATEGGHLRRSVAQEIPTLQKDATEEFAMLLTLPKPDEHNKVCPGARIILRGEMFFDLEACSFTVPSTIRVAPPLPSVTAATATADDVLIFSHAEMQMEDYNALDSVCKLLNLRTHYVDLDHFLNEKSNCVDAATWAALRAKGTVLWAPSQQSHIHRVPLAELLAHAQAGAPIITADASAFGIGAGDFKYTTAGRRCVQAGAAFQLTAIKTDLAITDDKVTGAKVLPFLAALVGSMSTQRKLAFLCSPTANTKRLIGNTMLDSYKTFPNDSCCGGKPKIAPVVQAGLTLQDLVLASIRSDLSMDIHLFATCAVFDMNPAYSEVVKFAQSEIFHKPAGEKVAQLAADVHAVLAGSGISDKKCPVRKPELTLLANQCETIAAAGGKEPQGLRERIMDIDVIKGLSRRKRGMFGGKDPVDLSAGVAHYVYKGEGKQWF
uniref:Uncharacterized protein n=1 Tax=Spumella elongata TaxID=89044 RepID=A0A7S3M5M1_9STRA|mmetsp:Transcript_33796/g.58027  ORF Transcript_33796/g.58027 Transcript_33796/m.58027 type:complete len:1132 (+) Transcript_33796:2-3397(+)